MSRLQTATGQSSRPVAVLRFVARQPFRAAGRSLLVALLLFTPFFIHVQGSVRTHSYPVYCSMYPCIPGIYFEVYICTYIKSFSSWRVTDSEAKISRFILQVGLPGRDPLVSCLADAFSTALFAARALRPLPRLFPRARSMQRRDS